MRIVGYDIIARNCVENLESGPTGLERPTRAKKRKNNRIRVVKGQVVMLRT